MKYTFSFYTKDDFEEIESLILNSYDWDYPIFGLSRMEFGNGLHPKFLRYSDVWERTVGVYRENGKIVACAINEGNDDGTVFFLFDTKERANDAELLTDMIFFAKTTMSCVKDKNNIKRQAFLLIPQWNKTLEKLALSKDFKKDWQERILIRDFNTSRFDVSLPDGYSFADGTVTPSFYLANVHMAAFNYSIDSVPDCASAFADMRKQKHYNPNLDLCVLDRQKRPVAMANIWYDEKMPYCELEPLGVAWWERRKGIATAILNEAANRVMKLYPQCKGMTGGDQPFYEKLGFKEKAVVPMYKWEAEIYPSWDEKSKNTDYQAIAR